MQLNTRSRYAINAMIELALDENYGPISLIELSRTQCVSVSYLEILFSKLRKAGLVEATRGPGGGYSLGAQGAQISIADIVSVVDGETPAAKPPEPVGKELAMPDMTQDLWDGFNATTRAFLQSITLSDLARQQKRPDEPARRRSLATQTTKPSSPTSPSKANTDTPNAGFMLGQLWLRG